MNIGIMEGLGLALLNGAICITLPLIVSKAMQKKSEQVEDLVIEVSVPLVESEIAPQKV